jgi:transcriptional regulator with XRE-family HTH domain
LKPLEDTNMNFTSNFDIQKQFQDLIRKSDETVDIDFLADMIMYRFLSEIEILTDERKMTRKELAQKIGTSASYITQLYRGSKLLNLTTIAKLEKVFDITFEIKAIPNSRKESSETVDHDSVCFPPINMSVHSPEKSIKIEKQLVQEPAKKYQKSKKAKPTPTA